MTRELLELQARYANAVYQAARYAREAEIAKGLLDQMAEAEAHAQFGAEVQQTGGGE